MKMMPFLGLSWQQRVLLQAKVGWPLRFKSKKAALSYWNSGAVLNRDLIPLRVMHGQISLINHAYFSTNHYELEVSGTESPTLAHCKN